MKAMWNLMHVMQVLVYLDMLIRWPLNAEMMLESVHEAITLDNILPDYESILFGEDDSEKEEELTEEAKLLMEKNLSYDYSGLNLGIFGLFLAGLILLVLLYFLLKLLAMIKYFLMTVARIQRLGEDCCAFQTGSFVPIVSAVIYMQ